MSRAPAVKRRKLTPPPTDGDSSSTNEKATKSFYKQASSWNLEQDYENRPRKGRKKEESTRLPIKTADGLIQQVDQPSRVDNDDAQSDLEWLSGSGSEEDGEGGEDQDKAEQKPTVSVRQQIIDAKEELAKIHSMLNEDPEENIGAFKALAQVGQTKNMTVKKLALATQFAVYKDIIPGYRIRPLSEQDMETKVSKEVKRIRAYEQALVTGYQNYIKELAKLAQSGKGGKSRDGSMSVGSTAITCACSLLNAVPHFNFRKEVLAILVGKLSTRKVDDDFIKCRQAIETLFKNDDDGTPSLDAVAILTKMMKQRGYRVDESVLNTFLQLRLLSEFSWKASQNSIEKPTSDQPKLKKLKEKREFRTKKLRKQMKEQKAIDKEMEQADATVSHEQRDKMQAETLKLVFVTYFRILKIRLPNLMGATLEGLARYAHLINQDFFGDILEALKDLVHNAGQATEPDENLEDDDGGSPEDEDEVQERNLTREALLCVITAFALLEGQDAAKAKATLSLDLGYFITHLYRNLYALSLNPDIELSAKSLHLPDPNAPRKENKVNIQTTTVLLLRSLTSILLPPQGARAVPPIRIAAFTKQLYASALHLPEKSTQAVLGLISKVTKTHESKVKALWNTEERRGDGTFNGLSQEVEASNPFAGNVWEGELLRLHYSPAVREGVRSIEKIVGGSGR